jgi:F420-dependent oxidoreductase-like protein
VKIGITVGLGARAERTIDGLADRARHLEDVGFDSIWMPTAFGMDALTAIAAFGRSTTRVELGTAVVPTFPRHPVVMAQQALTTQSAVGGRFTLGIGLSHKVMVEDGLGIPYERPAAHMREYLAVLAPLLAGQPVRVEGELYRVEAAVTVADAAPVPLVVAAMGPAMLALAGRLADGTITSWVGPRTLGEHVVPTITAAAGDAGRPAPRVLVGLPIVLTGDPDAVRATLAEQAAWYGTLPAYRAVFDREGAAGPADVAIVGDEAALDAGLGRLADAGATDFVAQPLSAGPGSVERTLEYLAARAGVSSS